MATERPSARLETRGVLAGAYGRHAPGRSRYLPPNMLTHAVLVNRESGEEIRVLCRVKLENMVDSGGAAKSGTLPTCPVCLRRARKMLLGFIATLALVGCAEPFSTAQFDPPPGLTGTGAARQALQPDGRVGSGLSLGGASSRDAAPSDARPSRPATDGSSVLPPPAEAAPPPPSRVDSAAPSDPREEPETGPPSTGGAPTDGAAECTICPVTRHCCAPGHTCNPFLGCL